jgi:hypothetical protein
MCVFGFNELYRSALPNNSYALRSSAITAAASFGVDALDLRPAAVRLLVLLRAEDGVRVGRREHDPPFAAG